MVQIAHPEVLQRLSVLKPANQEYVLKRLGLVRPSLPRESGSVDRDAPLLRGDVGEAPVPLSGAAMTVPAAPAGISRAARLEGIPALRAQGPDPEVTRGFGAPPTFPAQPAHPASVSDLPAGLLTSPSPDSAIQERERQRQQWLDAKRQSWDRVQQDLGAFKAQDFWSDKATEGRIDAVLAIAFGGTGTAMTQTTQGQALNAIRAVIGRDLERRKARYAKLKGKAREESFYGQLVGHFGDERLADLAWQHAALDKVAQAAAAHLPQPQASGVASGLAPEQQRIRTQAEGIAQSAGAAALSPA